MSAIYYEEFGEISGKTPLEPFYEAMLPRLKNYGLTAEFPADKPSLAYSMSGIEFSVWIGEPPRALRYKKWQESPYANGALELTLESETLVHTETGEKLALKIFITDYISGLAHASGNLWVTVRFSGAESDVNWLKNSVAPVLAEYDFRSRHTKTAPLSKAAHDNSPADSIGNSNFDLMTNNVNFDELAQKAFAPGAGEADYERLFAAAFSLSEWHFIAAGEFPAVAPFCGIFPGYFDDKPMVAVFTDSERLRKYAASQNIGGGSVKDPIILSAADEGVRFSSDKLIFSLSPEAFLDHLGKLLAAGVQGIFFNPNRDSEGFFNGLQQLRPIRNHLASKNMLSKTEPEPADAETVKTPDDKSVEADNASGGVNFDALSVKATGTNAMEDLNDLFGAAFALPEWHFIPRGELPNVAPYVASNAQYADNQPMIRAFTDTKRLIRFAKENNLTKPDGSCDSLTIPTANIIEYLEGFIPQGAYGIWFNSDTTSDGFFIPLKQLRPIKEHLAKIHWQKDATKKSPVETLQFVVKEGLMMPSAEIKPAPYTSNLFWRVPADWVENGQIKVGHLRKIEREMSGGRSETIEGAFYVVTDYSTKVFEPEEVKITKWSSLVTNDDDLYSFFIASENGETKKVTAEEFQADVDASFQTPAKSAELPPPRSNLPDWGLAESPDGGVDLNLNINTVGAIAFETSIAPFYEAILPLLEDYKGGGEYVTLVRFEPGGMSQFVENIAENSHGAYLQIRRFLYLNPKNNVRIGVNSIHSKSLRHIRTNSELIISFELCKNLDNQTAALYYRFEGPKSEVFKLSAAIEPILRQCGFEAVSQ